MPRRKLLLFLASLLPFFSCSRIEVNEKYCTKLFYHNTKIIAEDQTLSGPLRKIILKSLLEENKPEAFIAVCVQTRSPDQLECELKAENFSKLRECQNRKNIGNSKKD